MTTSATSLVGRPVRWRGVTVGTVDDVLLDGELARAIGFEVACGDGRRRFLPLVAASTRGREIELLEPLAMAEPSVLDFYLERGRSLARLVGSRLRPGSGPVADVVLGGDGAVDRIVERDEGERARARSSS